MRSINDEIIALPQDDFSTNNEKSYETGRLGVHSISDKKVNA